MKKGGLKPLRAGNVVSRAGKWRTKAAGKALDDLEIKWGKDYPIVIKSWRDNCDRLTTYFQYPQHIRRIIYTTNTKESYHRQLCKATKDKGVVASDTALEKLVYLAFTRIRKISNVLLSVCFNSFALSFLKTTLINKILQ